MSINSSLTKQAQKVITTTMDISTSLSRYIQVIRTTTTKLKVSILLAICGITFESTGLFYQCVVSYTDREPELSYAEGSVTVSYTDGSEW